MKDESLKDKFEGNDRQKVESKVEEAIKWLESHPNEEADAYSKKQKELEDIFNPIMMKVYQKNGGMPNMGGDHMGGRPNYSTSESTKQPQVDEVD